MTAWRTPFDHPDWNDHIQKAGYPLSGSDLALYNATKEVNPDVVDNSAISLNSNEYMQTLKNKGTILALSAGTHDSLIPYRHFLDFAYQANNFNVPFRFDINYRAGHCNGPNGPDETENVKKAYQELLINGKNGGNIFGAGFHHYKRRGNDGPPTHDWWFYDEIFPQTQPIFLEAPRIFSRGQKFTFSIVGEAGMQYDLKVWKIDDTEWRKNKEVRKLYKSIFYSTAGKLPRKINEPDISYMARTITAPQNTETGFYLYELFYSLDGKTWTQVPQENIPAGPFYIQPLVPVFEVVSEEPKIPGTEIIKLILFPYGNRAFGLIEENIKLPQSSNFFFKSFLNSAAMIGIKDLFK